MNNIPKHLLNLDKPFSVSYSPKKEFFLTETELIEINRRIKNDANLINFPSKLLTIQNHIDVDNLLFGYLVTKRHAALLEKDWLDFGAKYSDKEIIQDGFYNIPISSNENGGFKKNIEFVLKNYANEGIINNIIIIPSGAYNFSIVPKNKKDICVIQQKVLKAKYNSELFKGVAGKEILKDFINYTNLVR